MFHAFIAALQCAGGYALRAGCLRSNVQPLRRPPRAGTHRRAGRGRFGVHRRDERFGPHRQRRTFTWAPAPQVPFQIIVVLAGGQVARPVVVDTVQEGTTSIQLRALTDEAVTVLGAAPSINTAPGSATTVLSGTQIARRNPENLMQALETVPGINQVSEGHASVPAVRGLARGRTLFLIDGGRVTAERRVGPSGTFLDPSVIEGIDIARGPGSVAYGSDALGGVVSVRTRRAEPGSPLTARVTGTIGAGIPESRGSFEVSKGLERGGVLVQAHVSNAEDYDSPEGEVFNSGWEDQGFLVHFTHAVAKGFLSPAGRATTAGTSSGRATTRRRCASSTRSRTRTASRRPTRCPTSPAFSKMAFTGFLGTYEQRTDQDRFATATTGAASNGPTSRRTTSTSREARSGWLGPARIEFGVDVNGRYGLEALDIIQAYDLAGAITRDTTNVSVDDARRIDTGVYRPGRVGPRPICARLGRHSRRSRDDEEYRRLFRRSVDVECRGVGFGAVTVGPFQGFSVTAQVSRGFRDPVLSDRYFRGPSGRGFITGNPDLEPETSLQFDLATRYTIARTQLAVFFYHYRIDDLIERYQTQPDFFFFRNRGRARLRGVRGRGALGARQRLLGGSRRAGRARARARRQREPRRHLTGDVLRARAQGVRRPRVRADAARLLREGRSARSDRDRRAGRDAARCRRRLEAPAAARAARSAPQSARRRRTTRVPTPAACSRPAARPASPPSCSSEARGACGRGSLELLRPQADA